MALPDSNLTHRKRRHATQGSVGDEGVGVGIGLGVEAGNGESNGGERWGHDGYEDEYEEPKPKGNKKRSLH